MFKREELMALIEILNRTPMSTAEKLWAQMFIKKLESLLVASRSETKEVENGN